MHDNSQKVMLDLLRRVAKPGLQALDVGAQDVNGSYRSLVEKFGVGYHGLDAQGGRNVDVVASAYALPYRSDQFDLVMSGQLIEHLELPLVAVEEMKRVCRPGGWVLLVAPFNCPEHRFPIDCWRFLPDGLRFLLAGFESRDAGIVHADCFGLGRKPTRYRSVWRVERVD